MSRMIIAALAVLLSYSVPAFAQAPGDFVEFQRILNTKCSQCHTRVRIEQALQRGENLNEILQKMISFGAQLTAREKQVLGVFWKEQRQQTEAAEAGRTVSSDPLGEYRAVLESRCTRCHSLERVEDAMMSGRSINDLVEMMRQRGAIVTESEVKVLGTFWGEPFKEKPAPPE